MRQCVYNIFESVTKKVKPRWKTVLPTEQCRKHCTLLDIVCAFRGTLHLQIFYKYVIHVRENPQFSDKAIFNIIYESSWSLREDGDIKIGEPCQSWNNRRIIRWRFSLVFQCEFILSFSWKIYTKFTRRFLRKLLIKVVRWEPKLCWTV